MTKPIIELSGAVDYVKGESIALHATLHAPDPLNADKTTVAAFPAIVLPPDTRWTVDDDLRYAVQLLYPTAEVRWYIPPKPEPE